MGEPFCFFLVDIPEFPQYLIHTSNERFGMNVSMTLTSKVAKEVEGPISVSEDSVLEGSLYIKGNLSDLIKIMEAIKKDHLHPKVEIHDVLKDFMVDSFDTLGSRRMYFFDQNGTLRQGRYNYDNTCLNKIACIKKIREILGTGLKESKDFVDGEGRNLSELEVVALRSAGLVVLARP